MKRKIVAAAIAVPVLAGCATYAAAGTGHPSNRASCTSSPAVKADMARLQRWVNEQPAGQQGENALAAEQAWVSQALAACKAHRPLPLLPLGS